MISLYTICTINSYTIQPLEILENDNDRRIRIYNVSSLPKVSNAVDFEVCQDGERKWILKVADEYKNSTVWEEYFSIDQFAFDELCNLSVKMHSINSATFPLAPNYRSMFNVSQLA